MISHEEKANQNHSESHSYPLRHSKKIRATAGKDVEKLNLFTLLVGYTEQCHHFRNSLAVPQKEKSPHDLAILLRIHSREWKTLVHPKIYMQMFTAVLCIESNGGNNANVYQLVAG